MFGVMPAGGASISRRYVVARSRRVFTCPDTAIHPALSLREEFHLTQALQLKTQITNAAELVPRV